MPKALLSPFLAVPWHAPIRSVFRLYDADVDVVDVAVASGWLRMSAAVSCRYQGLCRDRGVMSEETRLCVFACPIQTVLVQRKQLGKLSKTGEGSLADDVSSIDTRHPGTAACTAAGVIAGMCPSMPVSGCARLLCIMHGLLISQWAINE
jgi:hypothetical protein